VPLRDVVITGLGVISPIGIGNDAFWTALRHGKSGVRPLTHFDASRLPIPFGGEVLDFDPKEFVKPRKSLKVMSRDIQFAVTAASLATAHAGIEIGAIDPERFGVVFGADMMHCPLEELAEVYRSCAVEGRFDFRRWGEQAMAHMYPLWMLKYLPNMPACHIGIALDARGHNNSIVLGDVSSLLAVSEGAHLIARGQADTMIVGGASSQITPSLYVRSCAGEVSHRADRPEAACRPFDAARDGAVLGEGAAALVLESRQHATARGARIIGRVLACTSAFAPRSNDAVTDGTAIRASIQNTLLSAGLSGGDVGHVNANGQSTVLDDRREAQAIRAVLDDVPVTAPKSFFGNLGAGTGAVELAVSVLALSEGVVPPTLNYEQPDPECPINVISRAPLHGTKPTALVLNQASAGQAAAVLIAAET